MKTFKIVGIVLLTFVIILVTWSLILPSEFTVTKTAFIKADKNIVFKQVNDFKHWQYWSPWHDTLMKIDYAGPDEGVGAKMSWFSESEGKGEMQIIESEKTKHIKFDLVFSENLDSKAEAEFLFEDMQDSVKVTWTMHADGFDFMVGRWIGFIVKNGVKASFSQGLENLKNFTEALPEEPDYNGYTINKIIDNDSYYLAYGDSALSSEIDSAMNNAYDKVFEFAEKNKIKAEGAPVCFWAKFDLESYSKFICAIPVADTVQGGEEVKLYLHKGGTKLMTKHIGPYSNSADAWNALHSYTVYHNYKEIDMPYEEYIVGPSQEENPEKWITNIYFSVD